jgi:hypothetical protein
MTRYNAPQLIRRVVDEIWNLGNLDLADALFAADYVNHGGLIPDLVHGPEAVKVAVTLYKLAFPRHLVAVDHLIQVGDRVSFEWTATDPASLDSAKGPAALTGGTIVRLLGEQITESWMRWADDDVQHHPPRYRPHPGPAACQGQPDRAACHSRCRH